MSRRIIKVIDLSEWTEAVPVANAECMVAQGVEGIILQAYGSGPEPGRRNEYFHQALDAFRVSGVKYFDPYVWAPSDWQAASDWIGDYRRFCAGAMYLDVESGAGVDDGIVAGVKAAGWEPRIYASPSSWAEIMGGTTRYSDLKLWLAKYLLRFQRPDGYYRPGFGVIFPEGALAGTAIGGWGIEDLVGWQTTGTVPDFCNESVDTSVFFEDAFILGEEDMKPYLIAEAGAPYVYITDGVNRSYLRDMAHADALGIPRDVKVVPAGTLASVARLDNISIAAPAVYPITGSARPG